MGSMGPLISIQEATKSFGNRQLFTDLSVSVHQNERLGLIGPNGAGKSTLLKIMKKQLEPESGEVVHSKGVRVAMLEQSPQLDLDLTIMDTLLNTTEDLDDPYTLALEAFSKVGLQENGHSEETKVRDLSGGWRKRVALGCALAIQPDVLLLDEPTNHLDIDSILWLERLLNRATFSVVSITHDRAFLQNTSTRILEIDKRYPGGAFSVDGTYSDYVQRKSEFVQAQQSQEESLKNRLRRETEWLRQGAKARSTKQKARIQRAGDLEQDVQTLSERNMNQKLSMAFVDSGIRSKRLIEAKQISKSYGDNLLFENVDVFLGPGSCLGLIGNNGCGKTTLIQTLLGRMEPDSGSVFQAENLSVAYFEQHKESLSPTDTPISTLCPKGDHVEYRGNFVHVRSYLGKFLFTENQANQPVASLSGGEQARLLMAKLMLQPASVLVLDEPTNDLDFSTLDVLEECIQNFPGAVILVSHDRYFLDTVSNTIKAFVDEPKSVVEFASVSQWEQYQADRPDKGKSKANNKKPKNAAKLSYKEERELASMEQTIGEKEGKISELNKEAQANASNSGKLKELYEQINALQSEVEKLFERWQELDTKKKTYEA